MASRLQLAIQARENAEGALKAARKDLDRAKRGLEYATERWQLAEKEYTEAKVRQQLQETRE